MDLAPTQSKLCLVQVSLNLELLCRKRKTYSMLLVWDVIWLWHFWENTEILNKLNSVSEDKNFYEETTKP